MSSETIVTPLEDLVRRAIESRLYDVHTALPATVKTFDAATQTVNVQPALKRLVPNENGLLDSESLPEIRNVPVIYPGGQDFGMYFPLVTGDTVLLVFPENSPAEWRATGQESTPGDTRRHGLSGAVALPGWRTNKAPRSVTGDNAQPHFGTTGGPQVYCKSSAVEVKDNLGVASPVALAELVKASLDTLFAAINSAAAASTPQEAAMKSLATTLAGTGGTWPVSDFAATKLKAQ